MSNAPERIWVTGTENTGSWNSTRATIRGVDEVEYIRRDAITPAMAAEVLLANRWAGYGNRNAMNAVVEFIHQETGRVPFPFSFYDGVLQAAFRAIAAQGEEQ